MPARGKGFKPLVHSRRGPGWGVGAEGTPADGKVLTSMIRRLRRHGGPVYMEGKGFVPNNRAVALVRRWFRNPRDVCVQRAEHVVRGPCLAVVRGRWKEVGDQIAPGLVATADRHILGAFDYEAANPNTPAGIRAARARAETRGASSE